MSNSYSFSIYKSIVFFLVLMFSVNFDVFAQTRKSNQQTAAAQTKQAAAKCSGAWTGTISYTRTQSNASSNIVERISGRGQETTKSQMNYNYKATVAVVESPERNGESIGRATISGGMTSTETVSAVERSSCDGGKTFRDMRGESSSTSQVSGSGNEEASVGIGVNDNGTYMVSVGLQSIKGKLSGSQTSKLSGQCTPVKDAATTIPDTETPIEGHTIITDGTHRINPSDPNRISGSYTATYPGNLVETVTWNLQKCGAPLRITDLQFADLQFPSLTEWKEISEQTGTIDGNLVRIKAKVFNGSGDNAYTTVKFTEAKSGEVLPDGKISLSIDPGESREVEYVWDTSGFAWDDFQKPKFDREIKVEIEGTDESKTEKIKILPKPIILVHGLWSNAGAWAEYQSYLQEAHSFAWNSFAVGADPEHGKMNTGDHPGNSGQTNTIAQNARELAKQIKWVREQKNAWHVDIVAHSMGGLISRFYINSLMPPVFDGKPEIAHLVMLGTPNMGSPCADLVGNIFEFYGAHHMNAMRELRPSVVAEYNKRVTNRKGVKFSILIGYPVPRICQKLVLGDGVVEIKSALYDNNDAGYAKRHHVALTGREDFKNFVLPRLAIGPRRAQTEKTAQMEKQTEDNFALSKNGDDKSNDRYGFADYLQKASYLTEKSAYSTKADDADLQNVTTRQKVELKANETKEIEIPIKEAAAAGIVLVASPAVSAVLIDEKGAVVGESKAGTDVSKEMFRMIAVEKPVTNGVWKLQLANSGDAAATIYVGGFVNAASEINTLQIEAGKPSANGKTLLTAQWRRNDELVLNANITAEVTGQTTRVEFFDDGKHGDGKAGDGVYGATVANSGVDSVLVKATAEANDQTQTAIIQIGGAANVPPKLAKPLQRGK